MGLAAGLNEYAYADEDPISLTDPYGNEAVYYMYNHPAHPEDFGTYTPCQMAANIEFTLSLIPVVGVAYDTYQQAENNEPYEPSASGAITVGALMRFGGKPAKDALEPMGKAFEIFGFAVSLYNYSEAYKNCSCGN